MRAGRVADRLMNMCEGQYDDKELLVITYEKWNARLTSNNGTTDDEMSMVHKWVQEQVKVETVPGVYRINFDKRIYIFNYIEDESGMVLAGWLMPKTFELRVLLLTFQERYLMPPDHASSTDRRAYA